jgi:hypothetical protein
VLAAIVMLSLLATLAPGTLAQPSPPLLPAHDIQGPTRTSPIVGATVTIEAVVTGRVVVEYWIFGPPSRGLATITVTDRARERTYTLVGQVSPL